jgi:hypothetical protein
MVMNDKSEYIVEENGRFFIDVWDCDTGAPVFEKGEVFQFEHEGVTYKGMAEWDEEEMVPVLLVK